MCSSMKVIWDIFPFHRYWPSGYIYWCKVILKEPRFLERWRGRWVKFLGAYKRVSVATEFLSLSECLLAGHEIIINGGWLWGPGTRFLRCWYREGCREARTKGCRSIIRRLEQSTSIIQSSSAIYCTQNRFNYQSAFLPVIFFFIFCVSWIYCEAEYFRIPK